MDDESIINLYWQRSEKAIAETHHKYGSCFFSIAYNVLANREDAEESVNDTYLAAWNKLPPHRPAALAAFLGKITRNISISRWRARRAEKRGAGEIELALEELDACIPGGEDLEDTVICRETLAALNRFLSTLPGEERNVFLRRYWCMDSVAEIAASFGFSESKVKSMLHRTRGKLRAELARGEFV